MNTWRVILATMVIFATGVVTGGLLVRYVDRAPHPRHAPGPPRNFPPASPGGFRLEFLRRVEAELDLTPDQRERTDKLLKESQDRTRKIMEPVAPRLRDEVQRTKEEFRAILTPPQQARFDEIVKQQQHPPHRGPPLRERPSESAPQSNAPAATNSP